MVPKYPNKLAEARDRAGLTQQQVADAIGVTLTGYQNYEYGKRDVRSSTLRKLSKVLNCSAMYLLGLSEKPSVIGAEPSCSRQIPIVGRMAAGEAREAIEQCDRTHPIPDELYHGNEESVWVEISGNSMNKLFPDGSLVLINMTSEVRNGDVAAVFVNGDDVTIKRVFFEDHAIRLHPESYDPEYRDRVIDESDPDAPDVHIFGKAVAYTSPLGWRA